MLFMVQKEVALKFDYNLYKLNKYKFFTKISSSYKRCFNVSASVFTPKPNVNSSVVKFTLNKKNINWLKAENFAKLIFKNKRKKIQNNFKLDEMNYKKFSDKRIEEINIENILTIYNFF